MRCGLYAAVALVYLVHGQVKAACQLACKALGALRHVVGVTVGVARHAYYQRVRLPFLEDGGNGSKKRIALGCNSFERLGSMRQAVAHSHACAPGAKVEG